jgi:hypothetical protein
MLERDGLPLRENFNTAEGAGGAEVLLALLVGEPAVLLVDDGLSAVGDGVVDDPLLGPGGGLAPPVGVGVEGGEVDVGEEDLGVVVVAVGAVVGPVAGLPVEVTLGAGGDEVVGVDGLDEGADLVEPAGEQGGGAVGAAGEVAGAVGAAAGLVGNLPGEDGGGVLEAGDDGADVVLEGVLDGREAVELVGVSGGRPGGQR